MTSIGSLVFCNDCGNLLEARTSAKKTTLKCDICGTTCKDTSAKVVITRSKPADFPSALRAKRSEVQTVDLDEETHAKANELCEKCESDEVTYTTAQLRSADEGSTVFFTCHKCNHRWTQNN